MKVVHSPVHASHAYSNEFEGGRFIPAKEVPARADLVLDAIKVRAVGEIVPPQHFGNLPILRVHAPDMVHLLEHAWVRWAAKYGYDSKEAFPSVWPARGMSPESLDDIDAALGYYCFDTATPIVAGTWGAARTAADCAVTAAQFVMRGDRAAVALCRPPGHHAASDTYGGYCFLNNAAIAAQCLIDNGRRVAILDVDFHHGNGTQSIFYDRADVLTISIHGDPAQFYPHFSGFASETGSGPGEGFNANYPMPIGTGWGAYSLVLDSAIKRVRDFGADALVVPLGVDTYLDDPAGGFRLHGTDYVRLGSALGRLNLPTVITLEGGYRLDAVGPAFGDFLTGFVGA